MSRWDRQTTIELEGGGTFTQLERDIPAHTKREWRVKLPAIGDKDRWPEPVTVHYTWFETIPDLEVEIKVHCQRDWHDEREAKQLAFPYVAEFVDKQLAPLMRDGLENAFGHMKGQGE